MRNRGESQQTKAEDRNAERTSSHFANRSAIKFIFVCSREGEERERKRSRKEKNEKKRSAKATAEYDGLNEIKTNLITFCKSFCNQIRFGLHQRRWRFNILNANWETSLANPSRCKLGNSIHEWDSGLWSMIMHQREDEALLRTTKSPLA